MTTAIDDLLQRLGAMDEKARADVAKEVLDATRELKWVPNPGPQTDAYFCPADVMLYGGEAGGGKSSLLNGLSQTQHRRSLLMRRQYTDLGALIEEAKQINGGAQGFNGQPPPKLRTADGRLINFGAAKALGDEQTWQGQAHDLLGLDEAVQFLEAQVRFLMGWVRVGPGVPETQRCRTILATNPPVDAAGQWIIGMFRPWLDITHENPAKHGELRWYVTDPDGNDMEVAGADDIKEWDGKRYLPESRTFIRASLSDNPFLVDTGYQSKLDALPEPLRSAVRDGNFMAAREDDEWQVIPSAWVRAAQNRWKADDVRGLKMTAMGVDVAQGGADQTVIAMRHGTWFDHLQVKKGAETPDSPSVAALIMTHRRDGAVVIVDVGGGYGGGVVSWLKENEITAKGFNAAKQSTATSSDSQLRFVNKRAESWWRLREALDPAQEGGSPIALPPDEQLVADLTAPTWQLRTNGVQIESKEDVKKRLGRSTDRADAVIMAWSEGQALAERKERNRARGGRPPQVVRGYANMKRRH